MNVPFLMRNSFLDRLEESYDVHLCRKNEVAALMQFIDTHWKKNHIMAKSLKMMDWQHYDSQNDCYTFMIAVEKSSQTIVGAFGYIPMLLQRGAAVSGCVSGAIWKVTEELDASGLGLLLMKKIICDPAVDTWLTNGYNLKTEKMYRRLGFTTCDLQQWFILNRCMQQFQIADQVLPRHLTPSYREADRVTIQPCDENAVFAFFKQSQQTFPLHKDWDYYAKRFFHHPYYRYLAYGIQQNGDIKAVIYVRICEANGGRAVRLVDYMGDYDVIQYCYHGFQTLLESLSVEYLDFMEFGFPEELLRKGGFLLRQESSIIIPNYFEPFVRENRDVHSAYRTDLQDLVIFKGDGDQDRPSFLPEGET